MKVDLVPISSGLSVKLLRLPWNMLSQFKYLLCEQPDCLASCPTLKVPMLSTGTPEKINDAGNGCFLPAIWYLMAQISGGN